MTKLPTEIALPNGSSAIPTVGLGTCQLKSQPGAVGAAVEAAIRLGYRHIDCASFYGNEAEIGEALTRVCRDTVPRQQLFITSKLWNTDHRRVRQACQQTLKDLQLEYLDLYLIHWPLAFKQDAPSVLDMTAPPVEKPMELDPLATLEQTWLDMEALVRDGLVKNIGVSNFDPRHFESIAKVATIQPAVNQVEMHPYLPQTELLAYCRERGIVVTAYSPLGSGMKPAVYEDAVICEIAARLGIQPAQVLLSWAVCRGTSVIPKSVTPSRIEANMQVIQLSDSDMALIDAIPTRRRHITAYGAWKLRLFEDE